MGEHLEIIANEIRKKLVEIAFNCGKSTHLGGALSIVDILVAIWGELYKDEDEFILSKGHAAMAYYAVMQKFAYLSEQDLQTFESNNSDLSVLATKNKRLGIKCSTGSLGQGIGVAVGMALGKKKKNSNGIIYTIVGNGESNEGSVWEAAMLAVQNKLDNLVIFLDNNGFQSDGNSENIISTKNINLAWNGFGFETYKVDGHDVNKIIACVQHCNKSGKPKAIICNTIKGYGISFMESNSEWHHNRLTETHYKKALQEFSERNGIQK